MLGRAWQVCTRDVYGLSVSDPGGLRAEQLSAIMRFIPLLSIASILNAVILVSLCWESRSSVVLLAWLACVVAACASNMKAWRRNRIEGNLSASRRRVSSLVRRAAGYGVLWGAIGPYMLQGTSGAGSVAVAVISTGLIYGGLTLLAIPAAALCYIGATAAGAIVSFVLAGPSYALPILPPLVGFSTIAVLVTVRFAMQSAERTRSREAILAQNANMERLLADFGSESDNWTWTLDAEGRFVDMPERVAGVFGLASGPKRSQTMRAALRRVRDERARRSMMGLMREPHAFRDLRIPQRGANAVVWWAISGYVVQSETGDFAGMRGVVRDVTKEHADKDRIERRASTDALTGLANRFAFDARLRAALAAGSGDAQPQFALHYLDLDGFKPINDTYGHAAGDGLLQVVGDRLQGCMRDTDFVARLGGDEFAIIQSDVGRMSDAGRLTERIIETLAQPCIVDGTRLQIGASIGVCLPEPAMTPEAATEAADVALYEAKAQGRGCARTYTPTMRRAADARRKMEADLRLAFEREEFALHYQPIVDLRSRRIVAFEALLRWPNAPGGPVSPGEFLPIAEKSGLIRQLGSWITSTACAEASRWDGGIALILNVSVAQLREPKLVEEVRASLERSGLAPDRLFLEFCERELARSGTYRQLVEPLEALRDMGVHIGLDNFGTDVTSLSILRSGLLRQVKVDRSLIAAAQQDTDEAAIACAMIALARSFHLTTVAEGIETTQQFDWAAMAGCDRAQGFHIGRPINAATVRERLREETEQRREAAVA